MKSNYRIADDPRMVASAQILADAAPPMDIDAARTIARILGPALAAVTARHQASDDATSAAKRAA